MTEKRYHVTLVDRMRHINKPKSRRRRIVKKWHTSPRNWVPLMVPVGTTLCLGKNALASGIESNSSPYFNTEDPSRPRMLEMHSLLWEKVKREAPEFAARCDVFRKVGKPDSLWPELVPVS